MGKLQSVSNDPQLPEPVAGLAAVREEGQKPADLSAHSRPSSANIVTIVAAAVILTLFTWLFYFMVTNGVSSAHWDRLIALYNSVQTIVAAAVGALLGAQVSAGQATVARAAAEDSRQRAAKLETNIKGFQTDIARSGSVSESTGAAGRERLLIRAMTLLH